MLVALSWYPDLPETLSRKDIWKRQVPGQVNIYGFIPLFALFSLSISFYFSMQPLTLTVAVSNTRGYFPQVKKCRFRDTEKKPYNSLKKNKNNKRIKADFAKYT